VQSRKCFESTPLKNLRIYATHVLAKHGQIQSHETVPLNREFALF
jgi:hypothetical protein